MNGWQNSVSSFVVWLSFLMVGGVFSLATVGLWFWSSLAVFLLATVTTFFLVRPTFFSLPQPSFARGLQLMSILLLHGSLAYSVIAARTDAPIFSVWHVLPWTHIAMYAATTALTFWYAWSGILPRIAIGLWVFTTASVFALLLPHGFGFDPFLHRAAVQAIVAEGTLSPLRPLYVGQYALYVVVSHVAGLSPLLLDRFLVALLWSCTAACAVGRNSFQDRPWAILALGIIAVFFWSFTVPIHLALAIAAAWIVFRIPALWADFFVTAALILLHPMIGVPFSGYMLGSWLRWSVARTVAVSVIMTAGVFLSYAYIQGGSVVLSVSEGFRAIFWSPYLLTDLASLPWYKAAGYGIYRYLWIPGIVLSLFVWRTASRQAHILWQWAFGFTILALFLASTTRFSDIISFEQFEFARRYLSIAKLFWVLGVAFAVPSRWWIGVFLVPLSTLGFWLSYPDLNAYQRFLSRNVTAEDYLAVATAEAVLPGGIVLSDQMLSAAALEKYGFRQLAGTDLYPLRYALPTGGWLYAQYFSLMTGQQTLENVAQTLSAQGVDTWILYIHTSWLPTRSLAEALVNQERIFMGINTDGYKISCHTLRVCHSPLLQKPGP